MKSQLSLSDLYRIKSLLIDSLQTAKNEERPLTELTIAKIETMQCELINWLSDHYSDKKVGA